MAPSTNERRRREPLQAAAHQPPQANPVGAGRTYFLTTPGRAGSQKRGCSPPQLNGTHMRCKSAAVRLGVEVFPTGDDAHVRWPWVVHQQALVAGAAKYHEDGPRIPRHAA